MGEKGSGVWEVDALLSMSAVGREWWLLFNARPWSNDEWEAIQRVTRKDLPDWAWPGCKARWAKWQVHDPYVWLDPFPPSR